ASPEAGRRPVASITRASAWAVTSAKSSSRRAWVAASMLGRSCAPDHERLVPTQVATRSATSHDTGLLLTLIVYGAAGPVVIGGRPARPPTVSGGDVDKRQ